MWVSWKARSSAKETNLGMLAIVGAPAEEAWEMAEMGAMSRMPWVAFCWVLLLESAEDVVGSSLREWGGVMLPGKGWVRVGVGVVALMLADCCCVRQ